MAKIKQDIHVHAHFNTAGEFTGYNVACWRCSETVNEYGVTVWLFSQEIELEVPEDEIMMKAKAANAVEVTMQAAAGKHHARMTALLGLKNRFLCLAAPDILDAGTSARGEDLRNDDDIPF